MCLPQQAHDIALKDAPADLADHGAQAAQKPDLCPLLPRCPEAEAYARGQKVSEDVIREIGRLAVKAAKARDSWRASKEYREHLIEVLAQRAVTEAIKRAGGKNVE